MQKEPFPVGGGGSKKFEDEEVINLGGSAPHYMPCHNHMKKIKANKKVVQARTNTNLKQNKLATYSY